MTSPWNAFATLLQALPPSIRRTLYSIVTAAGAVLALAQFFGWDFGIDMEKALAFYAVVSSPTGALALANVKPKVGDQAGFDPDYDSRDYDVASFDGSEWGGGADAWEETAVEDVDEEGAVDLSTEPSDESEESTDESADERADEPAFS